MIKKEEESHQNYKMKRNYRHPTETQKRSLIRLVQIDKKSINRAADELSIPRSTCKLIIKKHKEQICRDNKIPNKQQEDHRISNIPYTSIFNSFPRLIPMESYLYNMIPANQDKIKYNQEVVKQEDFPEDN